jgi:aconitate hydratase
MVTALALAGNLTFNPLTDNLYNKRGEKIKLEPPRGKELPSRGFDPGTRGYVPPAKDGTNIEVKINPGSERLEKLEPFPAWDGQDYLDMVVLVKAQGKCTTDHISPAGPWLRYRGHLDKLSDNLFNGAVNAFGHEAGRAKNVLSGEVKKISQNAREYKARQIGWIAVGDENYGEGSSREHAAMEPRFLGGKVIIAKSFARIHETNLKKQGMLALTFKDPQDYNKIREDDRLSIIDLKDFKAGVPLKMEIQHSDGSRDEIELNHSYNTAQIEWFKAGSALNLIGRK